MKKTLLATVAFAATGLAQATPIYLDNGVDFQGSGDGTTTTQTDAFDTLAFAASKSVLVVTGNSLVPGASVVMTNDTSLLSTSYGITAAIATPANVNIDQLNTPNYGNGFSNGSPFAYGFGGTWGLTYTMTLNGSLKADGFVDYTSGTISMVYQDGVNPIKVAEFDLINSSDGTNNQVLRGKIDFGYVSGLGSSDGDFVKNFWHDATTGVSLYDKWVADPLVLTWVIDNNNTPNKITTGNAIDQNFAGNDYKYTTITSGGTVTLNVPEPGSIALIGLALTGLAVASRARKQA